MTEVRAQFPVLLSSFERRQFPNCPRFVPWDWLAPHEAQVRRNHSNQTLTELAQRGGLGPNEIRAAFHGERYSVELYGERSEDVEWLIAELASYDASLRRPRDNAEAITEPEPTSTPRSHHVDPNIVQWVRELGNAGWKDRAYGGPEREWELVVFENGWWEVRRWYGTNTILVASGDERNGELGKERIQLVYTAVSVPLPSESILPQPPRTVIPSGGLLEAR